MFRKIIMSCFFILVSMSSYANGELSPSFLNFTIPPHASTSINNPSNAKLFYRCYFYCSDIRQIIFESVKGDNQISKTILKEGSQGYLASVENEHGIPLVIDILGKLKIINKEEYSVEVKCSM